VVFIVRRISLLQRGIKASSKDMGVEIFPGVGMEWDNHPCAFKTRNVQGFLCKGKYRFRRIRLTLRRD